MLDTDFASKPETCGSDTENASDTADRRAKVGLGAATNKSIGRVWRSIDVSEYLNTGLVRKLTLGL